MKSRLARVEGPNLILRQITPDDAAYVHNLRTDPTYNMHLSEVRGTAEDQRSWIEAYKTREAAGREFYYIITRLNGIRCGTVRLFEITPENFTWGSWILDQNKPLKAAFESAILVYKVAFEILGVQRAVFDVRVGNKNTLAFHRRFGAIETHCTQKDTFFIYSRAQYEADQDRYCRILNAPRQENT